MARMSVLVACERFGHVRDAFRALGHDAWSCDMEAAQVGPTGLGHRYHLRGDVLRVLEGRIPDDMHTGGTWVPQAAFRKWDLLIAFPPCTYLCSSGLHWNKRVAGRAAKTEAALEFARQLLDAPIARVCVENPRGCIGSRIRKADQSIQPYQFGHDASKETHLWLRGLPPLVLDPAQYVPPRLVCSHCKVSFAYGLHKCPTCGGHEYRPRWANQTDSGQNRLCPSETRAAERGKTYEGIAAAMAAQWGNFAEPTTTLF